MPTHIAKQWSQAPAFAPAVSMPMQPFVATLLLLIGLLLTALFSVTDKKGLLGLGKQMAIAIPASISLGLGFVYLLCAVGVTVTLLSESPFLHRHICAKHTKVCVLLHKASTSSSMRLHLTSAMRRGLILVLLILAVGSFFASRNNLQEERLHVDIQNQRIAQAFLPAGDTRADGRLVSWNWRQDWVITLQHARIAGVVIETPEGLVFNGLGVTNAKEESTILSTLAQTAPNKRTVHFIMPTTDVNNNVCKSLFSAMLNGYPAPILLNLNTAFRDAEEARFMKIAAIHRYLSLKVDDEDLVIIMDSYDTWFQLPFKTMISRYYSMQERCRLAHLAKYSKSEKESNKVKHSTGIIVSTSNAAGGDKIDPAVTAAEMAAVSGSKKVVERRLSADEGQDIPPYVEHAIFGADKLCWPNPRDSPACANVPNSTLPSDLYGNETDNDMYDFMIRPRWLNSGSIIGPASVMKEIYMRAFDIQQRSSVRFSDQVILADIFGQQDLPIQLDYESHLFQTMTHSHSDLLFLYEDQVEEGEDPSDPIIDPITGVSSATGARGNANSGERIDEFEDKQLVDAAFYKTTARRQSDKYLAWNRVSGNLPAVLHFNGPKLPLETWWGHMWWVHDQSPVHRLQRLKYVRRTGGAFVDDYGTIFKTYKDICGKFDIFEFTPPPFAQDRAPKGSAVSLDPEPFLLGMDPRKTPSQVLRSLLEDNGAVAGTEGGAQQKGMNNNGGQLEIKKPGRRRRRA
ncbi:hypothetical protein V1525DRAFT_387759 [Lipomyces kononenkoae]|uniref:Uncharacterized protein n=1 Tax=Lipomyces kononenkoae TaxID=34357 RepID=A0ACC3T2S2_LIPKO